MDLQSVNSLSANDEALGQDSIDDVATDLDLELEAGTVSNTIFTKASGAIDVGAELTVRLTGKAGWK